MAEKDVEAPEQEAPQGKKGEMIFDRVNQIIDSTGVTRSQAMDQLAQELGMKAGTVAANYYRIQRLRGGGDVKQITRARRANSVQSAVDAAIDSAEQLVEDLKELRVALGPVDEKLAKLARIEGVVSS